MSNECYSEKFFAKVRDGAIRSAEVIVPLALDLVGCRSVVDVGCGEGAWLAEFRKLGVEDILGVDGDYINRDRLQVPETFFRPADLLRPLSVGRTFDLAVSLEVAEHLPNESAALFVESLTGLAPVVLFSAAIPFQGGHNHVNEQWPDVWGELFRGRGYVAVDCIRPRVWSDPSVEWWYAQNIFLYVRSDVLETNAGLRAGYEHSSPSQFRLVHPNQYLHLHGQYLNLGEAYNELLARYNVVPGLKASSRALLTAISNAIRWRLPNFRREDAKVDSKVRRWSPDMPEPRL